MIDEIRIGTDFTSVAPIVPEPASVALLSLGAAVLLLRRRAA